MQPVSLHDLDNRVVTEPARVVEHALTIANVPAVAHFVDAIGEIGRRPLQADRQVVRVGAAYLVDQKQTVARVFAQGSKQARRQIDNGRTRNSPIARKEQVTRAVMNVETD